MATTFPLVVAQFIARVPPRGTLAINCATTNGWTDFFVNNHNPVVYEVCEIYNGIMIVDERFGMTHIDQNLVLSTTHRRSNKPFARYAFSIRISRRMIFAKCIEKVIVCLY